MSNHLIEWLAAYLKESTFTVVITGVGCSVESGVPDFRSPQGWWNKIDPCGTDASQEQFLTGKSCSDCGGKLRPNVVYSVSHCPRRLGRTLWKL